ncbi:MurR/RpiR family transcriptional regulator [Gymnodinialimonas sp. 57CJ19]|uniref:MurR/RpiR family transcriptional regulator n=1 Tax=Gymnodinialimonas sp. 57CJ19 TaxID=3138498 RepID=UPI0031344C34
MDPTLKSRLLSEIKQQAPTLSPRLRLAAKYVADHQADFGLDPIRETARKAGVSTFTMVRLAKLLGFDRFDDLREPFRHALVSTTDHAEAQDWLERWREAESPTPAEAAANSMAVVDRSLQRQNPEKLQEAVRMLLEADTVYLTAMRASYGLAYHFHYVARMALQSMELVPRHMSTAIDELNDAGPGDVLMAITFTPYSRETIEAAAFAKTKGARLIMITDSEIMAPGLEPDLTLLVSTLSTHHFACTSGAMALMETLLAMVFTDGGPDVRERITAYEDLRTAHSAYWSNPKKQ